MIVFIVLLTAVCGYAFYKTVWVKLSDDALEANEPEVISEKSEASAETVPVAVEATTTPVDSTEKETVKKPKTRKPSAKKAPSKTNKPVKKRTPRRRDL